jgi:hypothetical protein
MTLLALVVTSMLLAVTASPAGAFTSWTAPANLTSTGISFLQDVQLSADGTAATAIWARYNGESLQIQSASGTVSGATVTWGTPTTISSPGYEIDYLSLALSANGTTAIAAWTIQTDSSSPEQQVQTASATISGTTATWGAVTTWTDLSDYGYDAQVALSADGTKATAGWSYYDTATDKQIVQSATATVSGSTATWSSATTLSATNSYAYYARFAMSADGSKAIATWTWDPTAGLQTISATISGGVATWGSISDITVSGRQLFNEDLVLSADGTTAIASWQAYNTSAPYDTIVQTATASISGTSATWSAVTTMGPGDSYNSRLAISADGTKALVTWRTYLAAYAMQAVSGTISSGVATWGSTTTLSTGSFIGLGQRPVAMSADGTSATVAWFGPNGTDTKAVQAAGATISGTTATWETPTVISAAGAEAETPAVALSSTGANAVAVFRTRSTADYFVQWSAAPGSTAKNFGQIRDKTIDPQDRNREAVSGESPAGPKK